MLSLLLGPLVSLLVAGLKKIGLVTDHPKTAAAILSAIASVVTAVCGSTVCKVAVDALTSLAAQVGAFVSVHPVLSVAVGAAASTATAIATHEIALKPLAPKNPLQN